MKRLFILAIGILFVSSVFTSCTENILTDDELLIMETQAINKEDSTNPNNNGRSTIDPDED